MYFDALVHEIIQRSEGISHLSPFVNDHYKLEGTEFIIRGFEISAVSPSMSVSFKKVSMDAIVGNKRAKADFMRFIERLLCYDPETRRNPIHDLGGLPPIVMGDGIPGTGKSMLIAAVATILEERCSVLGIPFDFAPLPETIVSTYQGGTAERADEWFRRLERTDRIIFAPIDDAENNLEDRTRQGVSSGVREFIGAFLRRTEGASAINYGNRLIGVFTNLADQIDAAVRSRIQYRTPINGAQEYLDFMDQNYIWIRKYDEQFTDLKRPDYEFMSSQKIVDMREVIKGDYPIENDDLAKILYDVSKKHDKKSHDFFAKLYDKVQQRYPFFSSRSIRNIQSAADARIMDFDFPKEWWEDLSLFFRKDYDTKVVMLTQLRDENLGGIDFSDLLLYESLHYIENEIRIQEEGLERAINDRAKNMFIHERAEKKYQQKDYSPNN